jgi:hypothetical protein
MDQLPQACIITGSSWLLRLSRPFRTIRIRVSFPIRSSNSHPRHLSSVSAHVSGGIKMSCKSCKSENQSNFNGEIAIHFPGLKVWTSPSCGCFQSLWSVWIVVSRNLQFPKPSCAY